MPATLAPSLVLYCNASRGDADARAELKAMTELEREAIAPVGLGGIALESFIATGRTLSEQLANAKNSRHRALLNASTRDTVSTSTNTDNRQENHMPATAAVPAAPKTRTAKTATTVATVATVAKAKAPTGLTPRQLAEALGTDPRTLRQVIRSLDLGVGRGAKYSFTKAQAAKIEKAFAKRATRTPAAA